PHAPGAAPHPANAEGRDPDSPGSRPSALRTSDSRSVAEHTPHGRVDAPSTRAGPRVVKPGAPPRTLPSATPYSWPRGPSVVVPVDEEAAHRGGSLAHGARTLRTHRRHRLGHRRLHLLLAAAVGRAAGLAGAAHGLVAAVGRRTGTGRSHG